MISSIGCSLGSVVGAIPKKTARPDEEIALCYAARAGVPHGSEHNASF